MKKLTFLFISSFLFISCVDTLYKPIPYYDSFTDSQIIEFPGIYGDGLQTSFKMINKSNSYKYAFAYFDYQGNDWLFIETIWIKISGEKEYISLNGDLNREVLYGGRVSEKLTLRVNDELISFMRRSRGKTVIIRLNGDTKYKEIRFPIGAPGEGGQWDIFLNKYDELGYES